MFTLQEALTMQLDEIELLETAYPEITFDTPDARPLLRAALAESVARQDGYIITGLEEKESGEVRESEELRLHNALASVPLLSFRCPLSKQAQLRVRLPRRYPDDPLQTTVEGTPQLSAAVRKTIAAAASDEARRLAGEERREPHCLQVLSEAMGAAAAGEAAASSLAREGPPDGVGDIGFPPFTTPSGDEPSSSVGKPAGGMADSRVVGSPRAEATLQRCSPEKQESGTVAREEGPRREASRKQSDGSGGQGRHVEVLGASPAGEAGRGSLVLGRRLIYSHHIIAQQKRTGVVKAARELELGGFSKVGWPGVIVIEGEETSCEDFVKTLRRWRWKHLAVRGEETVRVPGGSTVDEERLLPRHFEELGEKEGVSALAQRCRDAGLGELFSTLLR